MKRLHHNPDEGIGNRQSAMFAKKSLMYCWGCDRNMVGPGQKCSLCGHVDTFHKNTNGKRVSKKRKRKMT